jgi:hypothetical protein
MGAGLSLADAGGRFTAAGSALDASWPEVRLDAPVFNVEHCECSSLNKDGQGSWG